MRSFFGTSNAGIGATAACFMAIASMSFVVAPAGAVAQSLPAVAKEGPPGWAYPVSAPDTSSGTVGNATVLHVPGSAAGLTRAQTTDRFAPPDWHPQEHPAMPAVVAKGRQPSLYACAYCHLPTGAGRSENASLAGLPAAYIEEQMADMKAGLRVGAVPTMTAAMNAEATVASDVEVREAAEYFAGLRPKSGWIRVVESDTVPRTEVIPVNVLAPVPGGALEPIRARIIEVPEDVGLAILRDSDSGYVAYVPKGSIAAGRDLVVTGGNGKTIACATCHGVDLRGVANIPQIAGRSPTYIFRQLYDFKSGARHGAVGALMKAPVAGLSNSDMISIAAYLASITTAAAN